MQARWIQLPFDPVRGTFDDTPLVRALEERPATAVREYLFHCDDRPHLGCFVQWRRPEPDPSTRRMTESDLTELFEELEKDASACPLCGTDSLGGVDAIEMRRVSPPELQQIEREGCLRRARKSLHDTELAGGDDEAPERNGAGSARSASRKRRVSEIPPADAPEAPEEEPLDGAASRAAEALRAWRNTRRRELDVPAYRVLTNRQLEAIARRRPDTLAALAEIAGLGPATLATHGEAILACLKTAEAKAHAREDEQEGPEERPHAETHARELASTSVASAPPAEPVPSS